MDLVIILFIGLYGLMTVFFHYLLTAFNSMNSNPQGKDYGGNRYLADRKINRITLEWIGSAGTLITQLGPV